MERREQQAREAGAVTYTPEDFGRDAYCATNQMCTDCPTGLPDDADRPQDCPYIEGATDRIIAAYRDLLTHQCVHASPDGCTAYSREVAYRDLVAENERWVKAHADVVADNGRLREQLVDQERARQCREREIEQQFELTRKLQDENERLTALTDTLAGKHPDAAEMLFRERKLNETLLDLKEENERLREQRIIVSRVKRVPDSGFDLMDERDALRAEVERLQQQFDAIMAADGVDADRLAAAERVCEAASDFMDKPDCVRAWAVSVEQAGHIGLLSPLRTALAEWEATR